jgi:hypothetical protein
MIGWSLIHCRRRRRGRRVRRRRGRGVVILKVWGKCWTRIQGLC